jgi:hypothetical protein
MMTPALFGAACIAVVILGFQLLVPCETSDIVKLLLNSRHFRVVAEAWLNPFPTVVGAEGAQHEFRVVLLGDSLVKRPMQENQLGDKIRSLLPDGMAVSIHNCAFSARKIAWILSNSLPSCALPLKPNGAIIFMDTDVSDEDESTKSTDAIGAARRAYQHDLSAVIVNLLSAGTTFVAICSPGVLGETSFAWFQPNQARFHHKTAMLDDYSDMNRRVAANYSVEFIDVRRAFLDAIPQYQLSYAWCVSRDGEHLNERGTKIIALLFAQTIQRWVAFSITRSLPHYSTAIL